MLALQSLVEGFIKQQMYAKGPHQTSKPLRLVSALVGTPLVPCRESKIHTHFYMSPRGEC